ncbi:MAG: hypothetical protein M1827_001967 [Pycnora praestabilis]|nr:MAG: hypothetical protein M1827_001967 [Pycnora praestabilis]
MGSSASKATRAAARQYPQTAKSTTPAPHRTNAPPPSRAFPAAGQRDAPGPTVYPRAQASGSRNEGINLDASDPDFAASLRSLGVVQPNPTQSNSSTFNTSPFSSQPGGSGMPSPTTSPHANGPNRNGPQIFPNPATNPALLVLRARDELAAEAEEEFLAVGRRGHKGRRFLDVVMVRQVLMLRDEKGMEEGEIERKLGLRRGVVGRLGERGVVGDTSL